MYFKYKYKKLLPFNIRIPFHCNERLFHFTLYQYGKVLLEIDRNIIAKLVIYKKNKIKIKFMLNNDIRDYRIKFTDKIPLVYRGNVKFIGRFYYYFGDKICDSGILYIYKDEYDCCLENHKNILRCSTIRNIPDELPPSYDSIIQDDIQQR